MSDMDYLERQALERASQINKSTFKPFKGERIKQKVTSLPVEFPDGYSYPSFKTVFSDEQKKEEKKQDKKQNTKKENFLSDLMKDPESALLTGLIMLLRQEGADETLLAALGYILL